MGKTRVLFDNVTNMIYCDYIRIQRHFHVCVTAKWLHTVLLTLRHAAPIANEGGCPTNIVSRRSIDRDMAIFR